MHTPLRLSFVFGFLIFASAGLRADDLPRSAAISPEWQILGAGTTVMTNQPYSLFNNTKKATLKYAYQSKGINLSWDQSTSLGNIRFFKLPPIEIGSAGEVVRDHRRQELKFGDIIAIRIDQGGFFGRTSREYQDGVIFGSWSKEPVYAYEIFGGHRGIPLKVGQNFVLKAARHPWHLRYSGLAENNCRLSWMSMPPPY